MLSAAPLSDGQEDGEAADSPYHVFGRYKHADLTDITGWERNALRNAERAAGRGNVHIVRFAEENTERPAAVGKLAKGLFSLFHKRVAFVSPDPSVGPLPFDGMVHPGDLNTIVIDAESRQGFTYLLDHELGHSIQHQRPELFDALKKELLGPAKDWGDYDSRLAKLGAYDTREKREVEFVNDFIGSQFGEPDFWKSLRDRNRPVFGKLVDAALAFLAKIGQRTGKLHRDVRPYFDRIEEARAAVVETLEKYRQGEFPGASARKDLKDSPDNEFAAKLEAAPLRSLIVSSFNSPPSSYQFQPSDERRETILEIARTQRIALVDSPGLSDATRRFEEATGTAVSYFQGGDPECAGFTPPGHPELIFVRVDDDRVSIANTLAHELTHVAQKDAASGFPKVAEAIGRILTVKESAAIDQMLIDRGYSKEQRVNEKPAYLMGDAVSGVDNIGLSELPNGEALRAALVEIFDSLPVLSPAALPSAPDKELATRRLEAAPLSDGQEPGEAADSPGNVFGYDTEIIPDAELDTGERKLLEGIRRSTRTLAGGLDARQYLVRFQDQNRPGRDAWASLTGALREVFGKEVRFFKTTKSVAGIPDGVISPDSLNLIGLDADSRSGMVYLMGHELGHAIQYQTFRHLSHDRLRRFALIQKPGRRTCGRAAPGPPPCFALIQKPGRRT